MPERRADRSAEPRWLDDTEREAWLALVAILLRLNPALDSQLTRDSNLTHFGYQVIAMLSMAEDRTLRLSELAAQVNSSLSRLSHVVTKLEARGWVRREPDPASRRTTLAVLTDEGWEAVQEAAPGHVETVRSLVFDGLSREQVKQLTAIATQIGENIRESGLKTLS